MILVSECEVLNSIQKPHKVFAEVLEQGAIDQFVDAMNQDFVVSGALMPDAHLGYSLPIGGVVATEGVIVPQYVGYDIGCGVVSVPTSFTQEEIRENSKVIFDNIYRDIPVGFKHNRDDSSWHQHKSGLFGQTEVCRKIFDKNGLKQLGSLGGGNHFIEIGVDETDKVWVTIHSGSRGIGHAIATHYMKLSSGDGKAREGHYGLSVDSQEGKDYTVDMNFCLEFALENRVQMLRRIESMLIRRFGSNSGLFNWDELINRNHNHAQFKDGLWIHRKGATHAEEGMMGVIPGNMKDGSFIVRGKGNPDSLYSSSHGAGRALGRKEAQRVLNFEDFQTSMVGITALVTKDTLDESSFAYKNIYDVMEQQKDLVEIIAHPKPIINIKAVGESW